MSTVEAFLRRFEYNVWVEHTYIIRRIQKKREATTDGASLSII